MSAPIYFWNASLACEPAEYESSRALLSDEERTRADRFLRDEARRRFTLGRAKLRTILARLLDAAPKALTFRYGYNGKPEIVTDTDVQFNVSHSATEWCLAVTFGRRLGVDVERIRPDFASIDIARRFFSEREVADLLALPAGERTPAFFRCWTRKEAFIKAIGAGLGFPLDQFDVSLTSGAAQLRSIRGSVDEAKRWSMAELPAAPGFVAALAVEGGIDEIRIETLHGAR